MMKKSIIGLSVTMFLLGLLLGGTCIYYGHHVGELKKVEYRLSCTIYERLTILGQSVEDFNPPDDDPERAIELAQMILAPSVKQIRSATRFAGNYGYARYSAEDKDTPLEEINCAQQLLWHTYYFLQALPENAEELNQEEIQTIADLAWIVGGVAPNGSGSWTQVYFHLEERNQMRGNRLFGLPVE